MCTNGRAKLKEVGDELDCAYAELREARLELAQARKEKEAAELETQTTKQRCMCLTRNADVSNHGMCAALMIAFVAVGLLAYVWP